MSQLRGEGAQKIVKMSRRRLWMPPLHFQCINGTLYDEVCENGLVYNGGHGAVHNFCNYNWEVDCGARAYDDTPISSPGCLYQYGLYPVGEGCQTTFYKVMYDRT